MSVVIKYPCFASGEPGRLAAETIRAVATDLRRQLLGVVVRPLRIGDLVRKTKSLRVNGRTLRIAWDIEHAVHDDGGDGVLGVCEHDPDVPGTVMISLNAELLDERPDLLRSTAAHELGHAVFDMPAAMTTGTARAFRSCLEARAAHAPIDWREWRADEFMGAFLTPKRQLARSFAREAATHGVPLRWNVEGEIPMPSISANATDWCVVDAIAAALAEEFGVSEAFIGVRLRKYRLVR